jgi:hypothetical protein
LNNNGPSIEPCGTALWMSAQPLRTLLTFICCFRFDKSLYIYADDNTLSFCSPDFDLLISTLESESKILIEWFRVNKMQANPDKFQVGKKIYDKNPSMHIQNSDLTHEHQSLTDNQFQYLII